MPEDHIIGSGMTENELQLATWWVRHRAQFYSGLRWFLIILNVILWAFVLSSLLDAYAISYPRESRIPRIIALNQLAASGLQANVPQPIQPSDVSVFDITGNRKDFLVQLSNPNTTWWAEFDYHFTVGDEKTPTHQSFILPHSQRYITEIGADIKAASRSGQLVVDNLRWHRVDPSAVDRDYTSFSANRLQFAYDNVAYKRDLKVGDQIVGQTTFDFRNPSAYGYWNADITVILYRGSAVAGVTTIGQSDIRPGSTTPISINWFDNLSGITKTEIETDVNILDPKVYLTSERF